MKIRFIITLVACLVCTTTFAQKKEQSENTFRAKQQAYMAQKAELSQEESEKFFPLYFEFQDKKKEINKTAWANFKKGKNPQTSEKEYETIIDNFFDNQETIAKLEKEYILKYREILSAKKIYMIYKAERNFRQNMLKILQEIENKEDK